MILMKQERKGTWLEDWTSREQTGSLSRTPTRHLWMCVGYSKGTCVVDLKPKQECWLNKRTETNNPFCIGAQTKVPSSGVQVFWELGFNWHASRITQGCSKHKGSQLRLVVASWKHRKCAKVFLVGSLTFREGHLAGMVHVPQFMEQTHAMETRSDQIPRSVPTLRGTLVSLSC